MYWMSPRGTGKHSSRLSDKRAFWGEDIMSRKGTKREAGQMPEKSILSGFLSRQAFPQPWVPAVRHADRWLGEGWIVLPGQERQEMWEERKF